MLLLMMTGSWGVENDICPFGEISHTLDAIGKNDGLLKRGGRSFAIPGDFKGLDSVANNSKVLIL
jgi:hypothetical protein